MWLFSTLFRKTSNHIPAFTKREETAKCILLYQSQREITEVQACHTIPRREQYSKFSKNSDNTNYLTSPMGTLFVCPVERSFHFFKTLIMGMLFYLFVN